MTSAAALRLTNRELERDLSVYGPSWYQNRYRIHPERQITVPLVRRGDMEQLARQFFATVAKDPDLLSRRVMILHQWHQQRRTQ